MSATLKPTTQENLVSEFRRLTPGSARLAEEARSVFPSGVTHDSRYLEPYPIYVARAQGARKWDVDGREYVDYAGGHGALLLGHNHPEVVAAVSAQLARGTHYGASHELEVRWGQLVQQLIPSAERVRFTASGTEATLLALRLARAFTGRRKLLRFRGHFHGWHDHMAFGVSSHYDGSPTPGVLESLAEHVVLADSHQPDAVREVIEGDDDLAAVILEPTGASWGQVPVPAELLSKLRAWTTARGVVLIFDEVISGFRCSPGGAQAALGVTPDLTTLAKILAGGLPGGAIAGRAEILAGLDHRIAGETGRERIAHHGTFNANPLSAAAGIATLEQVRATDACQRASQYATRLRDALGEVIREVGLPWVVYGSYSGFHIYTNPRQAAVDRATIELGACDYATLKAPPRAGLLHKLRLGMLVEGVEIFNWPGGPTSAAHGDDDLARTVEAFRRTLQRLAAEGDLAAA